MTDRDPHPLRPEVPPEACREADQVNSIWNGTWDGDRFIPGPTTCTPACPIHPYLHDSVVMSTEQQPQDTDDQLQRFGRLLDEAWQHAGSFTGYPHCARAFREYVNSRRHRAEYGGEGEQTDGFLGSAS